MTKVKEQDLIKKNLLPDSCYDDDGQPDAHDDGQPDAHDDG